MFPCTWDGCDKTFKTKGGLGVHWEHHVGSPRFVCETCGDRFWEKGKLKRHTGYRHSEKRPFTCGHPGCTFAALLEITLNVHLRTHSGERPFACTWPGCGYAAAVNDTLVTHLLSHAGEKRYFCKWPGCTYGSIISGDLKKHLLAHAEFVCEAEGCPFVTESRYAYKQHTTYFCEAAKAAAEAAARK
jgi:hypothetical protein